MKTRNNKIFSLIELMVVISIFLIVLSLLQPSLASLQNQAQNNVCKNNLKVISGAAALQLQDYNNVLNPAGYIYNVNVPEINNPYIRVDGYIINPITAMSKYLNDDIRYDSIQNNFNDSRNPEYFKDFKCPSNDFEEGTDWVVTLAGVRNDDNSRVFRVPRSHSSYGMNNGFLGIASNQNQTRAAGEINRVIQPSKMMHMGEFFSNNNGWAVLSAWLSHMTLEDSYNAHTGNRLDWERHQNKMNILFADAHIESIDFYDMASVYTAKGIE